MSEQNKEHHTHSKDKLNIKEKLSNFSKFYDKNFKIFLFIPILLFLLCMVFLTFFYIQNGDLIKRDITLTGGTSIQVNSNTDINALANAMSAKFGKVSIREVSDILTGEQIAFIVETTASPQEATPFLEEYLGFKLTQENSSIEFTGSTIGQGFYLQILIAILFSFIFMGTVVFFIFSDAKKIKYLLILLSVIPPLLFFFLNLISIQVAFILSLLLIIFIIIVSVKYSIPAAAVIFAAFADIIMTLTIVNLFGMEVSSAGIIAFLMLIGYSVDTDILLTTRVLKQKGDSLNKRIFGAFKTGMTMTLTSISVVLIGLIITSSYSEVFRQLFTILAIGLFFDIFNTWLTNASMIKWYSEVHKL